jgi:hypothetical protein
MGKKKSSAKSDERAVSSSGRVVYAMLAVAVALVAAVLRVAPWGGSPAPSQRPSGRPSAGQPSMPRPSAVRERAQAAAAQPVVDTEDVGSCVARMEAGDCEADAEVARSCAATCASAPLTARCAGWVRLGHCASASPFMMVACAGLCPREQLQCVRPAPRDLEGRCPSLVANGACEANARRGNYYFLAQCFASCAKHAPSLLPYQSPWVQNAL